MAVPSRDAADALMAKLQLLLDDQTTRAWHEVLATAIALKHATAFMSEAAEIRRALDVEVVSKAYFETGRPGQAVAVLMDALAAISEVSCDVNSQEQRQARYELHVRHLLKRCYQACLASAPSCCNLSQHCTIIQPTGSSCCTSAASVTCCQQLCSCSCSTQLLQQQQVKQPSCCTSTAQQQQQYLSSSIANSQRMQELASLLNDNQQLALISADMAEQYATGGDVSSACRCYGTCMDACTAAAAAAAAAAAESSSWVAALLTRVVPAAVDAYLLQSNAAGAQGCLTAYNNILLALGKSAFEECAVCCEQLTGSTAVTLLGCGHIFHRACCNEWFGHKLFEAAHFHPECPLCRQVDAGIQPSEAALSALADMQRYYRALHEDEDESSSEESSEDHSSEDEAEHDPTASLHAAGGGPSMSSDLSAHDVAPGSSDTSHAPVELREDSMEIEQSEIESVSAGSGVETGGESESDLMAAMESEQEGPVASSTFAVIDGTAAAAVAALAAAFATPSAVDVRASQAVGMVE